MLTKVQAYSLWPSVQTLLLNANGQPASDLIQVRNIDGITPVKANINTSPFGSVDGANVTGSRVDTRNIVLTLHPNPDWDTWTITDLRKLLYTYFMPKSLTQLVFYSDDISPVEIYGYVESFESNPFSKDIEFLVSIICPDPYFTAVDPTILVGVTGDGSVPTVVAYAGDIETGFNVEVDYVDGAAPTYINVKVGSSVFSVPTTVDAVTRFSMNSVPGSKYVQDVNLSTGVIKNLLSKVNQGSVWPTLEPGNNDFSVISDTPTHQSWKLTYFKRYGGF